MPPLLATEEISYGVRGRLVWDESETVSSFNRWSFGERRTKKGFLLAMVSVKLNFHRYIGERKGKLSYCTLTVSCAPRHILKSIDRWSFGERRTN